MKRNSLLLTGWFALLCLVVFTRFYGLGQRAMSHDESLHTYYAWQYAQTGNYNHDPMMHGPLLFHLNAAAYQLFGDSDLTSRLAPALFGVLLILAAYPFRRWIGDAGALLFALLLTFAPDVLFYSRYIRNEPYIACFLLLWVYAIFRYLEQPAFRWMLLATLCAALSFATKEVTFMHVAILVGFLGLYGLHDLFRKRLFLHSPALDLAILFGTCLLPFACPFLHYALGWNPLDTTTHTGQFRTFILAGSLAVTALIIAAAWYIPGRKRISGTGTLFAAWCICFALFWVVNFTLYTSLFTHPLRGSASGLASGLGYWLSQHDVQRGSQPLFYYLMLLLLYNPLLLIASLAACLLILHRLIAKKAADLPPLVYFAAWWSLTALLLYTLAGERMPWLLVHITLPMGLLTAWWLTTLIQPIHWPDTLTNRTWPLILLIPAVLYTLLNLPDFSPLQNDHRIQTVLLIMIIIRFSAGILITAALLILLIRKRHHGRVNTRLVTCGGILLLFIFSANDAIRHAFVTYDLPTEHMVFAHGSNDLKPLYRAIRTTWKDQYNPQAPVVAYDQESAWPLTWYMRNIPNRFFLKPDKSILEAPIIICGNQNRSAVQQLTGDAYDQTRQILVWWPLQDYMHTSPADLLNILTDPARRSRLLDIILYRRYTAPLSHWPLRHDAHVFIRKNNHAPQLLKDKPDTPRRTAPLDPEAFGPRRTLQPQAIIDTPFDGIPLAQPRSAVMAPDGSLYIADTGNHRIVILNPDRTLRRIVSPTPPLKSPWGIAVATNNDFYVSDTWNGQIRRFNPNGTQLAAWGSFAQTTSPDTQPYALYGPRGLAIQPGPTQNLLVADTGNRRLLLFDPSGAFITAYAPFSEPVNATFIPGNQQLAVAEIWESRLAIIHTQSNTLQHLDVPFWRSRDASIKPFVAADSRQRLYLSVPDHDCIVVYSLAGQPLFHFGQSGTAPDRMNQPTGLFIEPITHQLIVADSGNNRILLFDIRQ
jgi:uncharacterized protein (TIGR03663 family)